MGQGQVGRSQGVSEERGAVQAAKVQEPSVEKRKQSTAIAVSAELMKCYSEGQTERHRLADLLATSNVHKGSPCATAKSDVDINKVIT